MAHKAELPFALKIPIKLPKKANLAHNITEILLTGYCKSEKSFSKLFITYYIARLVALRTAISPLLLNTILLYDALFLVRSPLMQNHALLALSFCKGIGPKTLLRLMQRFEDIGVLLSLSHRELLERGLPKALADSITTHDDSLVEKALDWQKQAPNRHIITFDSPNYPPLLREIDSPPAILYAEGKLACLTKPCIAVVGTRKPTYQGATTASVFAEALAEQGYTVVSGLANGIDAKAHQGSLKHTLTSLAVMGTGINVIYPNNNQKLAQEIIDNGLIVTEFPLHTKPLAGHFPRRNRIISGLSLCTLVIEATIKSGTMVTARLAMEQNRDVMAVPGSISNPNSAGCHHLIKEGALLVTSPEEIVEALGILPKTPTLAEPLQDAPHQAPLLAFFNDHLTSFDTLLERSQLDVASLSSKLIELEILGIIASVPGGYHRCKL